MTDNAHDPKAPRFNYVRAAAGGYKAMLALEAFLHASGLEPTLIHLIKLRVSQLNGCAFCIDMHWKDLRALGETEQRLYSLDAWHECPFYSDRERAALLWAEAVTNLSAGHVPDDIYQQVSRQFDEQASRTSRSSSPPSTPGTGSRSPPPPLRAPTSRPSRRRSARGHPHTVDRATARCWPHQLRHGAR